MTQNHSLYTQIPDIKENIDGVDAVLVDEEAVGSVHAPSCGAKILRGNGAFERYLHETKTGEPMVCYLMPFCVFGIRPKPFFVIYSLRQLFSMQSRPK